MSRNVCYTVPSDVPSLHALTLWSIVTLSLSVRQLHVLSTSWNELLRHWRSGCTICPLRPMAEITKWRIKMCSQNRILLIFWHVIGDHVGYIFWSFGEDLPFSHTFMTIFVIQVGPSYLRNRSSCRYQISVGTISGHLSTLLLSNAAAETPSVPWVPPRRLCRIWKKIHTNIAKHLPTVFSFSYASKGLSSYKMRYFAKLKFAPCAPRVNWNLR